MRGTLMCVILMVIGALMMGCTDSIIPCTVETQDVDCAFDFGLPWGDSDAAHGGGDWGDFGMVCNMEVSPLEECQKMLSFLDFLPDFLPIEITISCDEFEGMDEGDGWGVCGSSWSPF